jgi:hypothetical protein
MPQKTILLALVLAGIALWGSSYTSAQGGAIDTYCATCHNGRLRSPSGPLLDQLDASRIAANPDLWSRAYRQLQAGAMPPAGSPRPDRTTVDAVLLSIERALGAQAKPRAVTGSGEVATTLASMLWNSEPDAVLQQEAQQNRLKNLASVERQVVDGTPINGVVDLRRVLLQYPEAFRTTITEKLLIYASAGAAGPTSATPDSLVRARRILRSTPNPRWSTLIAAIVQ